MKEEQVKAFLSQFAEWAGGQPDILALALVGSYARGDAREDSDVDLVIISSHPGMYLTDLSWTAAFGKVQGNQIEDYGRLTSVRVWYAGGLEVEYGITDEKWAAEPLDQGTREVISAGMQVLFERGKRPGKHQQQIGPAEQSEGES